MSASLTHLLNSSFNIYSNADISASPKEKNASTSHSKASLKGEEQSRLSVAMHYIHAHKVQSTILALALGTIACMNLGNNNSNSYNPNEWTIQGSLNPVTSTFTGNDKVCSYILSLQGESIFSSNETLASGFTTVENESIPYRFIFPSKVSPLALLIHNHCQQEVQSYKDLIFNPELKTDDLVPLIFASASAHNLALWNELFTALCKNDEFKSFDLETQNSQVNQILEISISAATRAPATSMACLNNYGLVGTVYDPSVSIRDVNKSYQFKQKIIQSSVVQPFIDALVNSQKDKIDLGETVEQQLQTISRVVSYLNSLVVGHLVLDRLKQDKHYGPYFNAL